MTSTVVFLFVCLQVIAVALGQEGYPDPPPTFEASKYTSWAEGDVAGSRKGTIDINFGSDDYVKMFMLDLVGDAKQRGYAHGKLLAKEISTFIGPALDNFFSSMVKELDLSGLPEWLQKLIVHMDGKNAPKIANKAMTWVYGKEKEFFPQRLVDEMDAIAEGMCSVLECDVEETKDKIYAVNMLPELIRMSCTAYGAWGDATGGGLLQLRALDFGGGPFANYTVISTNRPAEGSSEPQNSFVSVTFPGFVGVITGISENGIGVSEKVWMVSGKQKNMQKGSYDGEADVFVLRDILELAATKEDAEQYMQNAKRTWGIFVGTGDYKSGKFDLTGYRQKDAVVYDDKSMPSVTGQPFIDSVVYVDKHPQPSSEGPNGTLPSALQYFYGQISIETTKQIVQAHETGDVHIAAYDFSKKQLGVAIGKINAEGEYGPDGKEWQAFNRPWTLFNLDDMFSGNY